MRMRKEVVLITGASGEVGHGLITRLNEEDRFRILALDVRPLEDDLQALCDATIVGDILDTRLLERLVSEYEIREIYHLAALLSTRAEFTPDAAHRVNVQGTMNLLNLAIEQSRWQGRSVKFLFPSSIAVYGLPTLAKKTQSGKIKEHEWNTPATMYGCNKLYCEHLGRYFANHYRQLAVDPEPHGVDFRSVRFPGLISAVTAPSGGTSDFAPEMLHHAVQNEPYACFVREDVAIPFMVMPDAIKSLLDLSAAPKKQLTKLVYNVTSFSLTAGEIRQLILKAFPDSTITFEPDLKRQRIVDSWPADVDDTAAKEDWGWEPDYGLERAFHEYLIPTISEYYSRSRSEAI